MISAISAANLQYLQHFLRTADVIEVKDARYIRVRIKHESRNIKLWVSFAMGNAPLPQVGDSVLVAGEDINSGYIIGHFPAQRTDNSSMTFNITQDKTSGKTTLTIPNGDLDLCAEKGSIKLNAAKSLHLNSPIFSLNSTKGNINIAESNFKGISLSASLMQTKFFINKAFNTIDKLVEKTKNAFRHTENLNQTKAGRMRTLVNGSYHLKSEHINEKAVKDVRIDGNRINLG